MKIRYIHNRVYGTAGLVFGIFLFTLGCFTIFKSLSGAILIIIGLFASLSVSSCIIDVKNYNICFSNELFGFIRTGKWIYVSPSMELKLTSVRKPYMVRCASNKVIDVSDSKFLVFLYDAVGKKWFLICKTKIKENAEDEIARLSDLLGIHIKES